MAIPMTDPTKSNADLMQLMQWLSPAFPLGSFAYSHGLETSIASGEVSDAAALGLVIS
jgi:urease accessory protein